MTCRYSDFQAGPTSLTSPGWSNDDMADDSQNERLEPGRPEGDSLGCDEYRIGAVARLTGISTDTIRAWERRYNLICPTRTDSGLRVYSVDDIERLLLVKKLKDRGEAVGDVARLSLEDLERRIELAGRMAPRLGGTTSEGRVRVALLDPVLANQLRERPDDTAGIEIIAAADSVTALKAELAQHIDGPVVALVRLPRLGNHPVEAIGELLACPGTAGAVVVYNFAPRKLVRQLQAAGATTMQAPVDTESLLRSLREAASAKSGFESDPAESDLADRASTLAENPPRLFTDAELGRLREIESAVDCECPHHMSSLVLSLVAFEKYSRECESLDERDAALHAHLYRETGRARVLMERALMHLCEREGIEL